MLIDMYDTYCLYGVCDIGQKVDEDTRQAVLATGSISEDVTNDWPKVYQVPQWQTAAQARAYAEYYVNPEILPEGYVNCEEPIEYNGSLYALGGNMSSYGYYPQELIKVDKVTYMTEVYHDGADCIVATAYFRWTGDHWILQDFVDAYQ
jgi:hypothetical protein